MVAKACGPVNSWRHVCFRFLLHPMLQVLLSSISVQGEQMKELERQLMSIRLDSKVGSGTGAPPQLGNSSALPGLGMSGAGDADPMPALTAHELKLLLDEADALLVEAGTAERYGHAIEPLLPMYPLPPQQHAAAAAAAAAAAGEPVVPCNATQHVVQQAPVSSGPRTKKECIECYVVFVKEVSNLLPAAQKNDAAARERVDLLTKELDDQLRR